MAKFQPTYRMDPKKPYNQEQCECILKQIIDKAMINFEYNPNDAVALCESLSEDIKAHVKLLQFDRCLKCVLIYYWSMLNVCFK